MLRACWTHQAFVHWPYPPGEVQSLLPSGLLVDTFQGRAWVSLTPFVMESVSVLGVPLPHRTFPETNLRTYVRLADRDGPRGVWFFTLEVTNPLMLTGRSFGVPYQWADLRVRSAGPEHHYTGRRRRAGGPSYRLTVRTGPAVAATDLDAWLTDRSRAYSHRAGILWKTPVQHEPWPLRRATLTDIEEDLTRSAGLTPPNAEPLTHTSPGVCPVLFGPPRPAATLRPRTSRGRA
ncbi:YqjF family protein [Streptomyces sp. NPDC058279]|uniref:YqjF family protein n=1 Tax=Streptomyces sp. NPDC058279 TaxID=3346418 RepID=UPI0036EA01D6